MLDSIFRALSELPDFIKNGTSSAVIFTILSSFLIWITRDIIAKFIFAKINYNLQEKLTRLEVKLNDNSNAIQATLNNLSGSKHIILPLKINYIEKLWIEICKIDEAIPPFVFAFDILTLTEAQPEKQKEDFLRTVQSYSPHTNKAFISNDLEYVRPFSGKILYSKVWLYRAIFGRIIFLIHSGYSGKASKLDWLNDKGIQQLLKLILEENELSELKDKEITKIFALQKILKEKIIIDIENTLTGSAETEEFLKHASKIIDATDSLKNDLK